jgi:predicted GNAT family acetyltransferase
VTTTGPDLAVLDDPVLAALDGPQRRFAMRRGCAVRFAPAVAPFGALPPHPSDDDWRDLAALGTVPVALLDVDVPPSWDVVNRLEAVRMVLLDPPAVTTAGAHEGPESVELGEADVDDMLALVAATHPGPFAPRTVELGGYRGIRVGGALVAMAGERMQPPGWSEVSAVCTADGYRGRGFARRLMDEVVAGILSRGERPFLHVMADNAGAIALYASMGFTVSSAVRITVAAPPGAPSV